MDATADHDRKFACRADRVDLLLIKRVPGTVVASYGRFWLGGGYMQRTGSDVVDAAVRQLVDELDEAFGFGRQTHDGIFAEQRACFARFHIGLPDVHAVNLDAFAAGLPDHVHAVVDHECHGIRLIVVFDDLRDITRHVGKILRVSVFGAQLDEACAPAQCVIDDVGDRSAFAILWSYHKIGAQVEAVSHRRIWIIVHDSPLIMLFWVGKFDFVSKWVY